MQFRSAMFAAKEQGSTTTTEDRFVLNIYCIFIILKKAALYIINHNSGKQVCASCRAFFRRSVQSKYYQIFFCKRGESCEVTLATRRSCQRCRFKKCLESGMRVSWVLTDGERNKKYNRVERMRQEQEEILKYMGKDIPSRTIIIY